MIKINLFIIAIILSAIPLFADSTAINTRIKSKKVTSEPFFSIKWTDSISNDDIAIKTVPVVEEKLTKEFGNIKVPKLEEIRIGQNSFSINYSLLVNQYAPLSGWRFKWASHNNYFQQGFTAQYNMKFYQPHYSNTNETVYTENFIWGLGYDAAFELKFKDYLAADFGAIIGMWLDYHYTSDYTDYNGSYFNSKDSFNAYFGGPEINLRAGYKKIFLNIDQAILFGTSIMYNINIGFQLLW
jgi:hypothetical protein